MEIKILAEKLYIAVPTVTIILFLIVVFLVMKESKSEEEYVRLYKEKIIPKFVKLVEGCLTYTPKVSTIDKILNRYVKPCFDVRTFNKTTVKIKSM